MPNGAQQNWIAMTEEERRAMVLDDVRLHVAELEARGYTVSLSDVYLARIGYAVDDWDFADSTSTSLISIEKNEFKIVSYVQGERLLSLIKVCEDGSTKEVNSWINALLPKAELMLFRAFGDGVEFELLGETYYFSVFRNGRFCEEFFIEGNHLPEPTSAYYDPPMPRAIAEVLEEFFPKVNA